VDKFTNLQALNITSTVNFHIVDNHVIFGLALFLERLVQLSLQQQQQQQNTDFSKVITTLTYKLLASNVSGKIHRVHKK